MAKLKTSILIILCLIGLSGCASSSNHPSLAEGDMQKLIAEQYNVSIGDIQVTTYSTLNDNYSVQYKIKKNGYWGPEGKGFYLSQINKDKNGKYKVSTIKY
jgi:hypothetical protein